MTFQTMIMWEVGCAMVGATAHFLTWKTGSLVALGITMLAMTGICAPLAFLK